MLEIISKLFTVAITEHVFCPSCAYMKFHVDSFWGVMKNEVNSLQVEYIHMNEWILAITKNLSDLSILLKFEKLKDIVIL